LYLCFIFGRSQVQISDLRPVILSESFSIFSSVPTEKCRDTSKRYDWFGFFNILSSLSYINNPVKYKKKIKMTVFWDFAPVELYRLFRGACCLHHQGDEAAGTSETSVNFYQTTRRYNPKDSHLQYESQWVKMPNTYVFSAEGNKSLFLKIRK
jgi:hypothetical protein